ncbi:MAG: CoA transferase [Acidobacteriia bacterium]|nr:CoA transferase [Terriglobia bacterium]
MTQLPLKGIKMVTLALNVPGPVAVARLVALGAECTKVEPPAGDSLKQAAPHWYEALIQGQDVVTIDLKTEAGRDELEQYLSEADLLVTSFRLAALHRLQLDWESLRKRFPRLCVVNIIGYPPPEEETPGHDLTYQATLGLLHPPQLPATLHADMAGAERTVSAALALLLNKARAGHVDCAQVSLFGAINDFAGPLKAGLTTPGGLLGGGFAFYSLYETRDGWIAVAALEPVFISRLASELGLTAAFGQKDARTELQKVFLTRTAEEWEKWAAERDLPIARVK